MASKKAPTSSSDFHCSSVVSEKASSSAEEARGEGALAEWAGGGEGASVAVGRLWSSWGRTKRAAAMACSMVMSKARSCSSSSAEEQCW